MMADTLNLLLAKNMPTGPSGTGGGAVGAGETLQVREKKEMFLSTRIRFLHITDITWWSPTTDLLTQI